MKLFIRILAPVLLLLLLAGLFLYPRPASITEWTSTLTAEDIQSAHFAKYYGVEKASYDAPEADYPVIAALLNSIQGKECKRDKAYSSTEEDHRLVLYCHNQLWLFKCCADGSVSLTFETPETATYYGCENKSMIIHNSDLWEFILTTTDAHAN